MPWVPPAPVVAGSVPVGSATYPIPGGTVLYVAPDGSDTNVGTLAAPKRTVAGAIDVAPSGAAIVLRAGEYHESVTVPSTTTLTIQAYPGEAVWFDGSTVYPSWSGSGPWTAPLGVTWSPISSGNYPQVGDGLAHLPEQVWIDDVPQTQVPDGVTPSAGQFSVNRTTHVLSIGTDPAGKTVRVAELRRWMLATGPVTLRGFGVRRYSPAAVEGPDSALIYVAGSSYGSTIEDVVFRESGMHGLAIIRPITLDRVTVEDCNNAGIQVTTATGATISRFVIRRCNSGGWHPQPITAGIKVTRTDGIVIRDGIVDHIDGAIGVWFDVSNTRFVVANVSVNDTEVGLESELSGGGKYDGVQHTSWFINCRTANSLDWAVKVMDSDHVTIANCDLDAARVCINYQQDGRDNTGTPGNLTFEIVPWVSAHNRLWNTRVIGTPSIASMIAYHDPATPVRDPDGGADRVRLGWDFFDEIAGNWVPGSPPGSMNQLGKADGFRNSYNTWPLTASSPSTVGGPPGSKLGTNHAGTTAPSDTIAVPLPDDMADLLGVPHGHQQVGAILAAPTTADALEEDPVTLRQWLLDDTAGVTCTTSNVIAEDGAAASQVNRGSATVDFSATAHAGTTGVLFTAATNLQVIRVPYVATSRSGAVSLYHRSASLPPTTVDIAAVRRAAGQLFRIAVTAAGRLAVRTSGGALIAETADGAWAINRWNRVEIVWDNNLGVGAGTFTCSIYDGDSLTPDATLNSTTADLGAEGAATMDIGTPSVVATSWAHYFDSVQMDNGATSFIGPYVEAADVTGTLAAETPRLTADMVGTVTITGTLSASLPTLTADTVGTVTVPGTLDATTPLPTADMGGTVTVTGTMDATVPLSSASITGTITGPDADRDTPWTLALSAPWQTLTVAAPSQTLTLDAPTPRTLDLAAPEPRTLDVDAPAQTLTLTTPGWTLEVEV